MLKNIFSCYNIWIEAAEAEKMSEYAKYRILLLLGKYLGSL